MYVLNIVQKLKILYLYTSVHVFCYIIPACSHQTNPDYVLYDSPMTVMSQIKWLTFPIAVWIIKGSDNRGTDNRGSTVHI